MKRIVLLVALTALVAGCSRAGTQISSQTGEHSWTKPGYLRVAIQSDVKNLNPLLVSNTTDVLLMKLMFASLISADAKNNPVPILVTVVPTQDNGGISKDGLTITYHLRKNATWSDGVPVTSGDVKWSWQAIMNANNNVISRHGYDDIASIDAPDAHTVVVHLKEKFAPFVETFFADSDGPLAVAPAHVLSRYPNINDIAFNSAPTVTDGPFKFVDWVHGDHIDLVANPNFFLGKPKLKRITIHIIPDETTTVNLLRTHQIDWMFEASISNYPNVKDIPGVAIHWMDANGYESIQLNTQSPLLHDVRVRQALAYAIDKQRLIDTTAYGQERVATADQPPFMWAYDPNVKGYPYDPVKAKQLLATAGWTPGPNGILQKNGQPLDLLLVTNNSNVTRRNSVVEIQQMLHQVGVKVEVKSYQGDVLFAPAGNGGILQGGKFDLSRAGWYAGTDPDDSTQLTCANVAPHGYNYSRYCSKEMDALQQIALTHYDQATRKQAYWKIQQLLIQDVPFIYLYYERQMQPINVDFKGFDPSPTTEAWNAWQWSI